MARIRQEQKLSIPQITKGIPYPLASMGRKVGHKTETHQRIAYLVYVGEEERAVHSTGIYLQVIA